MREKKKLENISDLAVLNWVELSKGWGGADTHAHGINDFIWPIVCSTSFAENVHHTDKFLFYTETHSTYPSAEAM